MADYGVNSAFSCATSKVQNTSGVTKFFGCLPPHGVRLAANDTYTIYGDIWSECRNARQQAKLHAAIEAGNLDIIHLPGTTCTTSSDTGTYT